MARLFRAIIICIKPKGRIYEKRTVFIDDLFDEYDFISVRHKM